MSQKGSAARRRPSMDWPLSREERKCCAMKLYERDVQTANELLESKDETVKALKEEVKELRRASLGSTTRLSTDSTATGTRSSLSGQDSSFSESPPDRSPGKAGRVASPPRATLPKTLPAESPPPRDVPAPGLSGAGIKPSPQKQPSPQERSGRTNSPWRPERTMQRASSLEVFASAPSWWEAAWKKPAEAEAANVAPRRKGDAKPPRSQEGGKDGSPRRTLQRSQSLEKTSSEVSVWKGVWKGVRNVARGVKESATETARILADEARTVADDVRQLGRELAETGLGNQDAATGVPNVKQSKSLAPAEYMEWFLDFAEDSSKPGLELERHADGERWCVKGVETGLAVAAWNADAVPVTIYLQPGRREKVVRRMAVRRGDEIFAVDGETPQPDLDLEADEDSVQRLRKCQALTFRRKIPLAAPRASTEGTA